MTVYSNRRRHTGRHRWPTLTDRIAHRLRHWIIPCEHCR